MKDQDLVLNYEYKKGEKQVFPTHPMVKTWLFTENEEDEATLAQALAKVAAKNGLSANDLHHLFPAVLRMVKSDIPWAK